MISGVHFWQRLFYHLYAYTTGLISQTIRKVTTLKDTKATGMFCLSQELPDWIHSSSLFTSAKTEAASAHSDKLHVEKHSHKLESSKYMHVKDTTNCEAHIPYKQSANVVLWYDAQVNSWFRFEIHSIICYNHFLPNWLVVITWCI